MWLEVAPCDTVPLTQGYSRSRQPRRNMGRHCCVPCLLQVLGWASPVECCIYCPSLTRQGQPAAAGRCASSFRVGEYQKCWYEHWWVYDKTVCDTPNPGTGPPGLGIPSLTGGHQTQCAVLPTCHAHHTGLPSITHPTSTCIPTQEHTLTALLIVYHHCSSIQ